MSKSEFITYTRKSQSQLLRDLQKLHQKLYVRLPLSSEESEILVRAMDIAKDLR